MVAKGEGWGQGIIKRVWNGHELSAVFKVDNQQGPLFSTWNSAQCYGSLDKRGVREEWIHVYVWLSPFAVHVKLSHQC